jgi:hypothetical protein
MRSRSKFGKLWKRLADGVVQDVPPSLEECETCRELECTQERWESCERRLAAEAAALAEASVDQPAGPTAGKAPAASVQQDGDSRPGQPEVAQSEPKPETR